MQVEHYKKINRLTDELREFRHDYKNHMICLQSLLECQQYEDALDYVKGITKQEMIEVHRLSTGNQIADAILSDKAEKIKSEGITIQFDGFISDEIPAVCLCTILSNALDNAVEACEKINTEAIKEISIKCAVIPMKRFYLISELLKKIPLIMDLAYIISAELLNLSADK